MTSTGLRCPACHELPSPAAPVECGWCGAPHHAACWRGACAACRDDGPPRRSAAGAGDGRAALATLAIRGARAWFESDGEPAVALELEPSGRGLFAVAIRNDTRARQRVEVRRASPWLSCVGPEAVDLPPGETRSLRFAAEVPDPGLSGRPARGRLLLATEDDSRTIQVSARPSSAVLARRRRLGLLGAGAAALSALLVAGATARERRAEAAALAARGLAVQGLVLERQPGRLVDHTRWVYEVGGVLHERTGPAGAERAGDRLELTYLAERPEAARRRGEAPELPRPGVELVAGLCLLALGLTGWSLGQGQSSTWTPISKTRSGGISK